MNAVILGGSKGVGFAIAEHFADTDSSICIVSRNQTNLDEAKAKSVASGIFHVIVATFLVASGVTAVKALQAKNLSLATLEGALTAVKSGELKSFIADLFK